MAITSLNQAIAALGNQKGYLVPFQFNASVTFTGPRFHFYNGFTGLHGQFNFTGTNLAFTNCNNTTQGGIWTDRPTPASGENIHLAYWNLCTNSSSNAPALFYLVDIIGYYFNISTNTTATQNLTGTVDLRGYPYAFATFIASTTTGSTTQTMTLSYTNENNVSGRTSSTLTLTTINTFGFVQRLFACVLQGADRGMRSVQSITFSSANTGAGHLVLFVPIATLPYYIWNVATEREFITQLPALPTIRQDACLALFAFHGSTASSSAITFGTMQFIVG
ncbi:MAG: hypothetical protein QXT97_04905 [Candidatus Diapherotrites archaeon]